MIGNRGWDAGLRMRWVYLDMVTRYPPPLAPLLLDLECTRDCFIWVGVNGLQLMFRRTDPVDVKF